MCAAYIWECSLYQQLRYIIGIYVLLWWNQTTSQSNSCSSEQKLKVSQCWQYFRFIHWTNITSNLYTVLPFFKYDDVLTACLKLDWHYMWTGSLSSLSFCFSSNIHKSCVQSRYRCHVSPWEWWARPLSGSQVGWSAVPPAWSRQQQKCLHVRRLGWLLPGGCLAMASLQCTLWTRQAKWGWVYLNK